ncbi:histidine kinase, partial [uncultured Algibacter sp.]|uniref:histidine kinase n=1 Tax=uncultured Algibacter sp. TaxID=298659 RepID=UPI0032168037
QERHRIAEDLHDGILSHLFGTRIGMGFLELKGDKDTLQNYRTFLKEMQKIEKDIRDVSHELKGDVLELKTDFESLIDHYISDKSNLGDFSYKIFTNNVKFKAIEDTIKVNIFR